MHRIQAFEVNEEGKIIKLAFHELETEKIDAPSPAKTAKEVGALIYSTFLAGDYDGYAAVHSSGFLFLFWFPCPCSLSLHITTALREGCCRGMSTETCLNVSLHLHVDLFVYLLHERDEPLHHPHKIARDETFRNSTSTTLDLSNILNSAANTNSKKMAFMLKSFSAVLPKFANSFPFVRTDMERVCVRARGCRMIRLSKK